MARSGGSAWPEWSGRSGSSGWSDIRAGVRDAWVVGLGLIPLGMAFGLLMTQAGFAWWWTPIFSVVIFAGSMEFLAIDMVLAGVGPISSALTAFMVNFRHVFYGLTFPRHVVRGKLPKLYATYALTDEAYAVASAQQLKARETVTSARLLTMMIFINAAWVLAGIIGAVAAYLLPSNLEGLEFALTALFAVLAFEAFQASKDLSAPLIAAVLALIAALIAPGQMLIVGLIVYFGVLLMRFASPALDTALTWKWRGR